ncbi:MAG: hypothetical protein ATN36_07825 [Epulopiscium sp. Nele67-Bin005]|nr:MAG: hypothetical protein ATN36_07825 [Epulopiscium sp. Nele67-Bin005]
MKWRWLERLKNRRKKSGITVEDQIEANDIDGLFDVLRANYLRLSKLKRRLKSLEQTKACFESYESLSKDEKDKLHNLALSYKDSVDDRRKLQARLIRNNPALNRLVKYEKELPSLIEELKSVSNQVKITTSNIKYLKEEQEELREDRIVLINGYRYLKIFGVVCLSLIAIAMFLIFAMMQVLRQDIWLYITGICTIFLFFVAGLVFAKDKLEKEIRKNELLQQKVAKYINKYHVYYYNAKAYQDYEFQKLGVDSMAQLELYYNRYMQNKDHEHTYNQLRVRMLTIEQKMKETLTGNMLDPTSTEMLEEWILSPGKQEQARALINEYEQLAEQVNSLEEYEQDIYRQIFIYGEVEEYKETVTKKLDRHYRLTKETESIEEEEELSLPQEKPKSRRWRKEEVAYN